MSRFVLCVHCERHVRHEEQSCPFCLASLPKPRAASMLFGPVLTRAALLVAGAAGVSAAGCAEDPDAETETGSEDELERHDDTLNEQEQMAQPAYGVPIGDAGLLQPAYGVPVDPDPNGCSPLPQPAYGVPIDAGVSPIKRDAGRPLPQPAYGVPIDVQPVKRDGGPLLQPAYGVPIDDK